MSALITRFWNVGIMRHYVTGMALITRITYVH